jgi:hypothetical protein
MSRMFVQVCVLCAQTYATGAVLERHIREDHRPGKVRAEAGHGGSVDGPTSQPRTIRRKSSARDRRDGERAA